MKKVSFKDLFLIQLILNLILFSLEKIYYLFSGYEGKQELLTLINIIIFLILFLNQQFVFFRKLFKDISKGFGTLIIYFFSVGLLFKNFSIDNNDLIINSIYATSSSGIIFLVTFILLEKHFITYENKMYSGLNFQFIYKSLSIIILGGFTYLFFRFLDISQLPKLLSFIFNNTINLIFKLIV